jgi:predicted enzyme related to lactoylglutathione lyase
MEIKHRMIVFDAADIDAESAFWAGFLGGTVEEWGDRWRAIWVDGGWALGVQLAPDHVPPDWPGGTPAQQIHLDLYFEGLEAHDAAHDKALSLGAHVLKAAEDRTAPRGVQVYADPAGHPFCLCWVPTPN